MAEVQYVIDIAANMPAGEKTIAQLEQLTLSLMGAGASADTLHDAVAQATNALADAKTASTAANSALAAGVSQYGALEQAALQASKAEERLAKSGVVSPEVAASSAAAAAALEEHTQKLRGLENAAASAKATEEGLAHTLANVKQASAAGNAEFAKTATAAKAAAAAEKAALAEVDKAEAKHAAEVAKAEAETRAEHKKSVKEAEGFSPIVKQFRDLGDALSTSEGQAIVAAGAFSALATVAAAVALALVAATVALVSWAIGLADSARNARLSNDAMLAMNPAIAAASGQFAALTDETGLTSAQLGDLTKTLKAAKVSAADMPAALRAAALAERALGQGGSAEFVERLKEGKVAAGALSAEVSGKLAPIVAKQMQSLGAQSAKLSQNVGQIFGGLNIDPVLAGMKILVGLFDQNTAAGQAMKVVFEGVFQPLIDGATTAAYFIEAFVLGFLIGLTKLYIVLKPAIKAVREFFGFNDSSLSEALDYVKIAGELVVPLFAAFAVVLGLVGVAIGIAVAQVAAIGAAIYAVVAAVIFAVGWIGSAFIGAFQAVSAYLSNFSLVDLGTNIITGLANGLLNAGPAVLHAITGVVSGAIDAAKHLLGIASPSKVFADMGDNTGQGFVDGVDGQASAAQDSMAAMVEPPPVSPLAMQAALSGDPSGGKAGASSGAGGSAGGGGRVVTFNGPVYFGGTAATQAEKEALAEELTRLLEGDAASLSSEAA